LSARLAQSERWCARLAWSRWRNRSDVARGIAYEVIVVSGSVFEVAWSERRSTAKHINKAALRP
jgi:hypothetical protein